MCLIIASPTGERISDKILEEAAHTNSHGAGVAWHDPQEKKIRFVKGLGVEDVKKLLDSAALKGKAHVTHFRIATEGAVCPALTHPFVIDAHATTTTEGMADSVLFQNGTFSQWKDFLTHAVASSG